MPALLLLVWPDLAIVWINTCLNMMRRRSAYPGGPIANEPGVVETSSWNRLTSGEKASVCVIVLVSLALGVIVVLNIVIPFFRH